MHLVASNELPGCFWLTLGSVLGPLGASVGRFCDPLEAKFRGERAKWDPSGVRLGQRWPELARVMLKSPSVCYPIAKAFD